MKKTCCFLALLFITFAVKAQWIHLSETFDNAEISTIKTIGNKIFAGTFLFYPNHNKIYESSDEGQTWIFRDSINGHNDAYTQFTSLGNILFAADADSGIYKSVDNGISWHQIYYIPNIHYYPIVVFDSIIIVGTDYGQIYQSLDIGSTWILKATAPCNYIYCLAANSTNIFAGHCGGVVTSTDGGATWLPVNNGLQAGWNIESIAVKDSLVFATDGVRVYKTSDNGTNWINVTSNLNINSTKRCVAATNSNLLLSTYDGVYLTNDNGQTWLQANAGIGNFVATAFDTSGTYVFAATTGGVFRIDSAALSTLPCDHMSFNAYSSNPSCPTCTDGTATIVPLEGTPPYSYIWNLNPIQTTQTATGLSDGYYSFCFTDSFGCGTCDSVLVNHSLGINYYSDELSASVSPNPFNDNINFTLKSNHFVELRLFDIISGEILCKTFTNSMTLNTSQLSKGIYIYVVRNKNGVTKKGKVVKE